MSIQIHVNGQIFKLLEEYSIAQWLLKEGYDLSQIAIELNQHVIRRSELEKIKLKNDDRIEIVTLVGGG
jgi:sulfur carrier protein